MIINFEGKTDIGRLLHNTLGDDVAVELANPPSCLLMFCTLATSFLILFSAYLGKQQRLAQVLGPLSPCGRLGRSTWFPASEEPNSEHWSCLGNESVVGRPLHPSSLCKICLSNRNKSVLKDYHHYLTTPCHYWIISLRFYLSWLFSPVVKMLIAKSHTGMPGSKPSLPLPGKANVRGN